MQQTSTANLSEEEIRLQKCENLREKGVEPFAYNYDKTDSIGPIVDQYRDLTAEKDVDTVVRTAGRLMAKRGHGKATFGNVMDDTGAIQYYANINELGKDDYNDLLSLDVGDIIGLEGVPFVSKRGELTLRVSNFTLLTKALKPLPEKYHGLQDKELRYRMRYVDLITNKDVRDTFKIRSQIFKNIRQYLDSQGFMEVETPVLHAIYGGAAAKPFETHHNELDQNLYMRIALELHLKRLVVGGFERVYEIGRVFRNEGVSFKHNPEYTLLELYQAYADYADVMELTENLIASLVKGITGTTELTYQGKSLNFEPPFERLKLNDALEKYAGVTFSTPIEKLRKKAESLGLPPGQKSLKGHLINFIYDKAVEPNLDQPVFVVDYPWETSPLAKRKRDNPELVERFELIVNGMEIANAFSELNDPVEQEARFSDQLKAKAAGDDEAHEMDEDFINALKYGMPPTGGLGVGIDRVVMLLTDSPSIRDVLFFPHMREKIE